MAKASGFPAGALLSPPQPPLRRGLQTGTRLELGPLCWAPRGLQQRRKWGSGAGREEGRWRPAPQTVWLLWVELILVTPKCPLFSAPRVGKAFGREQGHSQAHTTGWSQGSPVLCRSATCSSSRKEGVVGWSRLKLPLHMGGGAVAWGRFRVPDE